MFESFISTIVENALNFASDIFALSEELALLPSEFLPEVWNAIQINSPIGQVITATASTIAVIFLLMEMFTFFNRADVKGLDAVEGIIKCFIKIFVALLLCQRMTTIVGGCFEITSGLIIDTANMVQGRDDDKSLVENAMNEFKIKIQNGKTKRDIIDNLEEAYRNNEDGVGDGEVLGGFVTSMILSFISKIVALLAGLISKLRFIEIYVLTAISPFAFATFCHSEYKQIAVKHIKRLLALGLQGFLMLICLYIYVAIVQNGLELTIAKTAAAQMKLLIDMGLDSFGYGILLVFALFQTGGWAKSFLDVH